MTEASLHTRQLVVFQGLPASFALVAERVFQKSPNALFLCLLEPGESPEAVRRIWDLSIQPANPLVHLFIVRAPLSRQQESIVDFCETFAKGESVDLDFLFLSEVSGFRESRRLTKWLRTLHEKLERVVPGAIIRRI